jgi:pimeloyl-ACP methyl ester carboxylesterase
MIARRRLLIAAGTLLLVPRVDGGEAMSRIERKLVPVRDAMLATEAWGEGASGTILLVMGATASMLWWPDTLMSALSGAGYRVIRFDLRDTGQSTTNPPGDVRYDVFDLAQDILSILDAYKIDAAHVVGMSLGAYVAQIAALQHPERFRSLTLIAAEPLGIAYEGEGIAPEMMAHFGQMATLDWQDRTAVIQFMLKLAELGAGTGRPFDRRGTMQLIERELQRTEQIQSAFNHSMVGGELPTGMTAAGLTMPLLMIHGSDDPVISVRATDAMRAAVPLARLLVLEGVGHELVEPDVPRIAEAILELAQGT